MKIIIISLINRFKKICGNLANSPDLLILDKLTTNFDVFNIEMLEEALNKFKKVTAYSFPR